jgi:hypothetical protein
MQRPVGIFGVRPGVGYGILRSTADFPAEALAALTELGRRIEWRPPPGFAGTLPPALGHHPLSAGWLLLRCLDAGPDELGRPHTLRIEAEFSPEFCADWCPHAGVPLDPGQSVLVANHPHLAAPGFVVRVPAAPLSVPAANVTRVPAPLPAVDALWQRVSIVLGAVCVVLLLGLSWLLLKQQNQAQTEQRREAAHQQALDDLRAQMQATETRARQLQTEVTQLRERQQARLFAPEIQQLQTDYEQLHGELQRLIARLRQAQERAEAAHSKP